MDGVFQQCTSVPRIRGECHNCYTIKDTITIIYLIFLFIRDEVLLDSGISTRNSVFLMDRVTCTGDEEKADGLCSQRGWNGLERRSRLVL